MIILDQPGNYEFNLQKNEVLKIVRIIKEPGEYNLNISLSGENSRVSVKTAYLVSANTEIAIADKIIHLAKNTHSENLAKGAIFEKGTKHISQKIIFEKGCDGSVGREKEEVLLLGKNLVNESAPIILCKEENVEGSHAVTAGELDANMLLYMKSRGLSYASAKKLILNSIFKDLL